MTKLKEFFSRFNWNNVDMLDYTNSFSFATVLLCGMIAVFLVVGLGIITMIKTGSWWLLGIIPVAAVIKLLVASYRKD